MKSFSSFLILLSFFSVSSQTPISFRDDFQDNRNSWNVTTDKDHRSGISGGNYFIEVLNDWAFWKSQRFGISAAKSFTVETAVVKQPGGEKNSSCGLMITQNNWDRVMFLVNPTNGDFVFTKNTSQGNNWSDYVKWTTNEAVLGEGKINILRIEKNPGILKLFINGKEVYKSTNPEPFASLNGYVYLQAGYQKIRADFDYLTVDYDTDVKMIADCIKGYKKVNLGSNVNSTYSEICPLIAPDGKTLFFTIRDNPANFGGGSDDIWYCDAINDTSWALRKNIGKPLNNNGINTLISITPDRNYALVMNEYDDEGNIVGPGVSSSTLGKKAWNLPEKLVVRDFMNKAKYAEYCLSADGNTLIMAIETNNTNGDRDLYVSFRNKRSKVSDKLKLSSLLNKIAGDTWSEPMNLGPVINSKGPDFTPFLAADGITLYFSSEGHKGFGSADVFMSRRIDSTWTKWSEPLNLGPEINTASWEAYYVVPASGKYAYLITEENTLGATDLVRIQQPFSAKPKPVILVKGKVLNAKTKEPIEAPIYYRELSTNNEVGSAYSNPTTGAYQIVLPYGTNYSFSSEKKGFFATNDNLDAENINEYMEIDRDLFLTPIEVGTVVRLNNIFFDVNKATLKVESYPELNRVVDFLTENKGMEIEIAGHTDSDGSDDYNLQLSQDRTKSVVDFLISKGIESARLRNKGYGESKPVSGNDNEEGKALNRRVEFVILKK